MQRKSLFFAICGTLSVSLILTGCGTTEQALPEAETNQRTETVGTRGQLISIQSDNGRAAGYNANSMIMTVQFNNGFTYEYHGIPLELMLKSKGADLSNSNIAGKFDGYSEAWSKSTFEAKSLKELMRLTEEFEEKCSLSNNNEMK